MANVTDPLACPIHGTNPQNLIEYITRQRIYDSQYWKEECFGLTAADVVEKAAVHLQAIGGSYGGNSKPTRFLSLILKMLQIQPEEGIVDELINNEEFKYVRALGMFYLRLTGRPAEIYEKLEPLYNDYRTLRFRNPVDWKLMHVDEFVDELLRKERVCGIALPRLPKREILEDAGYLDGPRRSAVQNLIGESQLDDDASEDARLEEYIAGAKKIESLLKQMSGDGNVAAKEALSTIEKDRQKDFIKRDKVDISVKDESITKTQNDEIENLTGGNHYQKRKLSEEMDGNDSYQLETKTSKRRKEKKKGKSKKKFGSLFKSSVVTDNSSRFGNDDDVNDKQDVDEHSEEYWNEQRAKLGLKPLKK